MKLLQKSLLFYLLVLVSACQTTLIAPYDADVRNLLVRSSVKVEMFWQDMQQTPADQRQYQKYHDDYKDISVDLKVLLKLNQMRPNNEDSVKQTEILIQLWQDDMTKHQQKDTFKDFLLKRRLDQYQREFDAMLATEDVKDI